MPELPEVEQVKKSLAPHILGKSIVKTEVYLPRLIKYPDAEVFCRRLEGEKIEAVARRGKYLRLELASGQFLLLHLRMTGALIARQKGEEPPSYTKIKFTLSGDTDLYFTDIRTFGTLYLLRPGEIAIGGYDSLGPEPLTPAFNADYLAALAAKAKQSSKAFILDQRHIAGLGNIYADEALFAAGIAPARPAASLTRKEIEALTAAVDKVIAQGIANRGTTFRDYKDGEGKKGSNQEQLSVYGRGGQPCKKCGSLLLKTKVAGRGTVYCPRCQK